MALLGPKLRVSPLFSFDPQMSPGKYSGNTCHPHSRSRGSEMWRDFPQATQLSHGRVGSKLPSSDCRFYTLCTGALCYLVGSSWGNLQSQIPVRGVSGNSRTSPSPCQEYLWPMSFFKKEKSFLQSHFPFILFFTFSLSFFFHSRELQLETPSPKRGPR